LLQARDQVDKEGVERRRREDAALAAFAKAEEQVQVVAAATKQKVDALERQVTDLRAKEAAAVREWELEKGMALLALSDLGRSADDLATMTGIGVKRVRAMIREARSSRPLADASSAEVPDEHAPAASQPAGNKGSGPAAPVADSSTAGADSEDVPAAV
jgi:hypothetical protein